MAQIIHIIHTSSIFGRSQPTVCVTGGWVDVDKAWEEEKLEARKMLENSSSPHPSSARYVGRTAVYRDCVFLIIALNHRTDYF
jgi:hypothetical protein